MGGSVIKMVREELRLGSFNLEGSVLAPAGAAGGFVCGYAAVLAAIRCRSMLRRKGRIVARAELVKEILAGF